MSKSAEINSIGIKEKIMAITYLKTPVKFVKMAHYVENKANLAYSTPESACFDICAALSEPVTIKGGERFAVPTAVKTAPESPLWFRINSRSGLALKNGMIAIGGIIDSDYRGEWKVIMLNTNNNDGKNDYTIYPGDKIAQVELPFPYRAEFIEVSEADFEKLATDRGAGGFGSSGR